MKKLYFHATLYITLLFSCNLQNTDSENLNLDKNDFFINHSVGVLNEEGNFQKLDLISLNKVIKSNLDFDTADTSVEFLEFTVKATLDENNNRTYHMLSRSTYGHTSISIRLREIGSGNMIVTEDGCKCESTDCSGTSCNASGSGATCQCSQCFNSCKKTSTSGKEDPEFAGS